MGRRGWASVAAPAGWYEVIRGPRPPTVSWSSQPKGWGKGTGKVSEVPQVSGPRGRWRQGAPQHVRQPETFRSRRNPDEVRVGASDKITRLQSALAVLGEDDETERSALEVALKKAQAQAVVPPVSEQIEHTQKFIERAKKRVVLADEYVQWAQEWKVECDKELLEAEDRLARLRVEVERPTPVPDPATEVQRLQHQLAQAQAQLLQHGCTSVSAGSTAKRPRRREDFVCSCIEEVIEWMSDRQMDIQEEIARANAAEVARLSSLVVQAATSLQPLQPSMVAQFGDDSMIGRSARSAAKYGHRGSRVGEASNPGPPKSLLRRRGPFALPAIRNVVPRVEQSQMSTVVDSDEEPLLHREVPSQFQSESSPGHIEVRTPPTRATQLEDVTNSLGAALVVHFHIFGQFRKRSGRRLPSGGHDH